MSASKDVDLTLDTMVPPQLWARIKTGCGGAHL